VTRERRNTRNVCNKEHYANKEREIVKTVREGGYGKNVAKFTLNSRKKC